MTRTVLVLLAGCVALVVATMTSILVRDIAPAAPYAVPPKISAELIGPSPNIDGKRDRLPVTGAPALPVEQPTPPPDEPLRQAFASDSPFIEMRPSITGPVPLPRERGRPGKPAIQKNYTLLSDMQIAAIRGRLRLTPSQEALWPNVETALRAVARAMHDRKQANPAGATPIDPDSAEIEQLKTAATPLLAQLREDQKREVRSLARIIGLEAVASQI